MKLPVLSPAKWLLLSVVALLAGWGGIEFGRWLQPVAIPPSPSQDNGSAVAQLISTPLATPDGQARKLADYKDKVLVINFWATWCPPCREEMPEFSQAQDQYEVKGIQFVGIAIDDAANVVAFSKKTPVVYPLLIGPSSLTGLMAKLGNRQQALPFTVIIGRDGKPVANHLGRLSKEDLQKQLAPLL